MSKMLYTINNTHFRLFLSICVSINIINVMANFATDHYISGRIKSEMYLQRFTDTQ